MPGTTPTLDLEWQLILAACSVRPPTEKHSSLRSLLQQPVGWKPLFALADRHGVQPLLFHALENFADIVPPDEMRELQQCYQINLRKSLLLARELLRIVERLSALNLEVMPYKGPALAELLYGDIALRQSGDIDLLIRAKDLSRVRDAVCELGYTPHVSFSEAEERAYRESGYECAFDGAAGPNLLEVQWAVLPRFYAVDFDLDAVFKRGVTTSVAGQPMRTPSSTELLLILAMHAAKHVWGRLVWLCDLARLMNLPNLPWDWIASEAERLGIVRILRVTMILANQMLGADIPAAAAALLPEDAEAQSLAEEMQNRLPSDDANNTESIAYFRLMMNLRERRADRIRFLQRLVTTPGPGEWKAVRLPSSLFPLYRLVRISRLAARLIHA